MDCLYEKCDPRLHKLLAGIDLQQLSRIPAARLRTSVVPNVGLIELVSAEAFESSYQSLYLSMFHGGERERPELISNRLRDDFAGERDGLAPYRVVGIRDHTGDAIAGVQFSVLRLRSIEGALARFTVPYVQYIYVRPQNRRQDLSEVLHTLVLAVATADTQSEHRVVPFTLFETEPPNHGTERTSQATATERTTIHSRSGARALMLMSPSTKQVVSAHVQPGLEPEDGPLTLVWAIRPSPVPCHYDSNGMGSALIAAYYQSLRDEGFPEKNIALAERIVASRCKDADFCDMPLSEVAHLRVTEKQ